MGGTQRLGIAMDSKPVQQPALAWIYLALAVAGGVLPWLSNLQFIREYGGSFDIAQFIALANANPAAESLSRDLLVGASAITVWMIVESRRLQMRHLWIVLLSAGTIAFAFAAPFFLFLRERRLAEMARTADA